jgi:hypothetical protein
VNRRSMLRALALIPALVIPSLAKPKAIRLRDIEREYDPRLGDCGRGLPISWDQVDHLDTAGYRPFVCPGTNVDHFPVYRRDGKPTAATWFGWTREAHGKHLVAAIEVGPMPKTPREAIAQGWSFFETPDGRRIFDLYGADNRPTGTYWCGVKRGPVRINYEVKSCSDF